MAEQDYKGTLNLPTTAFPMKANLPQREPERVAAWDESRLYQRILDAGADRPGFVLHDGPPYANNHIHQGHVLNKVLKDVVVKYKNLAGHRAPFVPGWDCHGLPIELQVDKQLGGKKRDMSPAEFRRACRAYAEKWLDIQRDEFKRLGVLARWESPYTTMSYEYEAQIVRELARFAGAGRLYKGKKPVYWCLRCVTALAEAEVEYDDHTSPSIYVALDVDDGLDSLPEKVRALRPSLVIWTTTPWTLPANLAVAVHPDFEYLAYELGGRALIVAKDLLHSVLAEIAPDELALSDVSEATAGTVPDPVAALAHPERVLAHFTGEDLTELTYSHPLFDDDRERAVLLADHVTLEQGTGLVHTAPGHGVEDYVLGLSAGLEIYNPVDDYGRYVEGVPDGIEELRGERVWDANPRIVERLSKSGHLLSPTDLSVSHSYPHCWRCSQPVIFRATHQWFISMEHEHLRDEALREIDRVEWIPKWGRDRIYGMLESRPDWCISRQRAWGVPIPAFYCRKCENAEASEDTMNAVADIFEKEGADAWFEREPDELVPGIACSACGGTDLAKETDILDVWFDSGVSYAAVCEQDPDVGVPVDLYLEGSDQHRGWFHSTLLAAVGTRGKAPYRAVLTHGFVVDGAGKKLSKKTGNYTPPEKVLKTRGAEILRLWVTSEDYRADIRYSDEILNRLSEGYRKIRNTVRFALGNLGGFDPAKHDVPASEWTDLDRWAWARFQRYLERVRRAYEAYEFHVVYHATMELCSVDLSSVYFDVIKDRLYCSGADWPERRAAQSVLWRIARDLLRVLAPIMSFTAEEAWQSLREEHPGGGLAESVFLAGWPQADDVTEPADFGRLVEVRSAVLKPLEEARREKRIGSSLQARIRIEASPEDLALLRRHESFLEDWFIVSQVELAEGQGDPVATVAAASGEKCARCWVFTEERGSDSDHPELCPRCTRAVAA